jgi:hypothetical protein
VPETCPKHTLERGKNMPENGPEPPETLPVPKYPPGLQARGKRLWRDLHRSADFSGCPETRTVAEEACYLADDIHRQRRLVQAAGTNTRVAGSNGQPVTMPEVADVQKNQAILLSMLKALRLPDDDDLADNGKLTRSQVGTIAAAARWKR